VIKNRNRIPAWLNHLFASNDSNLSETPGDRSVELDNLNLKRCYSTVLKVFFPERTQMKAYRVALIRDSNWSFQCDRRNRVISVNAGRFPDRDDLRAGLIQQICYALTSGRPGEQWALEMQTVIDTARRIQRNPLARRVDRLRQAAWIDELEVYFDRVDDTVTTYDGNALLDCEEEIPVAISFEDSLRFSVLEREIRREEAELHERRIRRKAAPSGS